MKKDKNKTQVIFKMENETDGEACIAFFPEVTRDCLHHNCKMIECYAHIGQHSEACIEYFNECRQSTEKEYKDLFNELENEFGYNLEIVKDITE